MQRLCSWVTDAGAAGSCLRRLVGLCLALALSCSVFAKDQSRVDTHYRLIRGLVREVGVSKVPLPRGRKGVRVDSKGNLDKAAAASQLSTHGLAIKPGMPVEITKIIFKSKTLFLNLTAAGEAGANGTSTSRLTWERRSLPLPSNPLCRLMARRSL